MLMSALAAKGLLNQRSVRHVFEKARRAPQECGVTVQELAAQLRCALEEAGHMTAASEALLQSLVASEEMKQAQAA
jgi:hypothetical protein